MKKSSFLNCLLLGLCLSSTAARAEENPNEQTDENGKIKIGYLRRLEVRSALSRLELPAANDGEAGALIGVEDNAAAGEFLGQNFSLISMRLKPGGDAASAVDALTEQGVRYILADLPADALLKAADSAAAMKTLIFNVGATDDSLREEDCRGNVVHVAPTRSMLADGLAQYLISMRWNKWFVVVGSHPQDRVWADALKHSAARFGAKVVEERVFEDKGGARHADSGVTLIQRQIPAFTQGAPAYDVMLAADESAVFADYLPYRAWDPRPVAGSAGLVPTSWDPSSEQWGATQLQQRFETKFARPMSALDMQAWTAARMIGDAASHGAAKDAVATRDFLLSKDFALAAYKGQKLTLRDWNLQLRQPILLSDGRNVVSVSPQEGFTHQFSELDTLGLDRPETKCHLK